MTPPGRLAMLRQILTAADLTTPQLHWTVRVALRLPHDWPIPEHVWQALRAARDQHQAGQHTQAEWALRTLIDQHTPKDDN